MHNRPDLTHLPPETSQQEEKRFELTNEIAVISAAEKGYASSVRELLNEGACYNTGNDFILAITKAARNNHLYSKPERVLNHLYPSPEATQPTEEELSLPDVETISLSIALNAGVKITDLEECKIEFSKAKKEIYLTRRQGYQLSLKADIPIPFIYGSIIIKPSVKKDEIEVEILNEINLDFLIYVFEHLNRQQKKIWHLKISLLEFPKHLYTLVKLLQEKGLIANLSIHAENIPNAITSELAHTATNHPTCEGFEICADAYEMSEEFLGRAASGLASLIQTRPLLTFATEHLLFNDDAAKTIGAALARSKTLLRLTYAHMNMGNNGLIYLVKPLAHPDMTLSRPPLIYLNLSDHPLQLGSFVQLATLIRNNRTLTHLELNNINLRNEGASILLTAIQYSPNKQLRHVSLAGNGIQQCSDDYTLNAVAYESKAPHDYGAFFRNNRSLSTINLSDNPLSKEMLQGMFKGLAYNRTLQRLFLNQVHKHVQKPLGHFLTVARNSALVQIGLDPAVNQDLRDRAAAFTQANYQQHLRHARHWMLAIAAIHFLKSPFGHISEFKLLTLIIEFSSEQLNSEIEAKEDSYVRVGFPKPLPFNHSDYPQVYINLFRDTLFFRAEMAAALKAKEVTKEDVVMTATPAVVNGGAAAASLIAAAAKDSHMSKNGLKKRRRE